jgi:hypothetical protein
MPIVVYRRASPELPMSDIPKSTKNQPRYWGFLLHWYIPVVTSCEVSDPEILPIERNSIIPASIRTTPIPSITEPPINAVISLIGIGQTVYNDDKITSKQ